MTRMVATLKLDMLVQFRNRFYHIGIATGLFVAFLAARFFQGNKAELEQALPILLLFAVGGTTLMFMAGLVLFEKSENTLAALTVTPLRLSEYLNSKILSITILAVLDAVMLVGLSYVVFFGLQAFNPLPMLAGIILLTIFHGLAGFILVVRYNSVTDFLMPVLLVGLISQLPFIPLLGMMDSPLFYVLPTMPQTLILTASFRPLEVWQWVYAIGYSLLLIVIAYRWATSAFRHHIIVNNQVSE